MTVCDDFLVFSSNKFKTPNKLKRCVQFLILKSPKQKSVSGEIGDLELQ